MCMVSFVGDYARDTWPQRYPWIQPARTTNPPPVSVPIQNFFPTVSRAEFDALKKEVEALHRLLQEAKRFDEETGQPDCEVEDKVELLRRVAKLVGVDLSDVFGVES